MLRFVLRVGEVFLVGFRGLRPPAWLAEFDAEFGLGGVLLFDYDVQSRSPGRNITSPTQLRELCDALRQLPSAPLVCVDQEGGQVRRLKPDAGFAELPSAAAFATLDAVEQNEIAATAFREMVSLGIDVNLAPVVDLNLNPENPNIGAVQRSFSASANVVRRVVESLNAAASDAGLLLCLKHYPGLGAAVTDSHRERTELAEVPPAEQLQLFEGPATQTPGRAILLSHALLPQWDPAWPVSLSEVAVGRLRSRQPDALLVSDDLQMQGLRVFADTPGACERGIEVGLDWLCVGNNLQGGEEECFEAARRLQARAGRDADFAARLSEAAARVSERKASSPGGAPPRDP